MTHFDFSNVRKDWLSADLFVSHMFDVSSTGLPYLEGFVNYVVKSALNKIQDENLYNASAELIRQENNHTREHIQYNLMLTSQGYYFDDIIQKLKSKIKQINKSWSFLSMLAFATCFESFTAVISEIVLEKNILANADPTIKKFWEWHMSEELEHKSVLMDLYLYFNGGYFRRILILTLVLTGYCFFGLKLYLRFLQQDKASLWKGLLSACGKNSFFRQSIVRALKCYSYRYHPNKLHKLVKLSAE